METYYLEHYAIGNMQSGVDTANGKNVRDEAQNEFNALLNEINNLRKEIARLQAIQTASSIGRRGGLVTSDAKTKANNVPRSRGRKANKYAACPFCGKGFTHSEAKKGVMHPVHGLLHWGCAEKYEMSKKNGIEIPANGGEEK